MLLVTGGKQWSENSGRSIYLDSTEVLEDMAGTWRRTARLPSARYGLSAASVENSIFLFGENFLYYIDIEHIFIKLDLIFKEDLIEISSFMSSNYIK